MVDSKAIHSSIEWDRYRVKIKDNVVFNYCIQKCNPWGVVSLYIASSVQSYELDSYIKYINDEIFIINMFNKNWCRQLGKRKAPFVTLVSASRLEIECQPFLRSKSTEYVTKRSIDCKSMWVESIKSYTFNRWAAYREVKSPPCLGGVKRVWLRPWINRYLCSEIRWNESLSGWQEATYEVESLQYSCTINKWGWANIQQKKQKP